MSIIPLRCQNFVYATKFERASTNISMHLIEELFSHETIDHVYDYSFFLVRFFERGIFHHLVTKRE